MINLAAGNQHDKHRRKSSPLNVVAVDGLAKLDKETVEFFMAKRNQKHKAENRDIQWLTDWLHIQQG